MRLENAVHSSGILDCLSYPIEPGGYCMSWQSISCSRIAVYKPCKFLILFIKHTSIVVGSQCGHKCRLILIVEGNQEASCRSIEEMMNSVLRSSFYHEDVYFSARQRLESTILRIKARIDDVVKLCLTRKRLVELCGGIMASIDVEQHASDDTRVVFRKVDIATLGFLDKSVSMRDFGVFIFHSQGNCRRTQL
jgi:hypothetical protein